MSTFKRLLNLGRGKLKVAARAKPTTTDEPRPTDAWVSGARHRAADAAEALADAIRPGEAPEAASEPAPPDAPDDPETPAPPATGPVKKRL